MKITNEQFDKFLMHMQNILNDMKKPDQLMEVIIAALESHHRLAIVSQLDKDK